MIVLAALALANLEASHVQDEIYKALGEVNRTIKVAAAKQSEDKYRTSGILSVPFDHHGYKGTISLSRKHNMRPVTVHFETGRSHLVRPKQGDRFGSKSDWEKHAFSLIHRIWKDVDGFVIHYRFEGESAFSAGGRKSWSSGSNQVTFIWMTHPVRNLQRQFSCTMDRATGAPFYMSCSPGFMWGPPRRIRMDNSKFRDTEVAEPSIFMIGIPPPPAVAGGRQI